MPRFANAAGIVWRDERKTSMVTNDMGEIWCNSNCFSDTLI